MAANVRIQGVPLSPNQHVWVGLSSKVYGIGKTRAFKICEQARIEPSRKISDLSDDEVHTLAEICSKYTLEGNLRREVLGNIKRLRDIGCYRGLRHKFNLPVRGQRTRTNAKTRKGKSGKSSVVR